MTDLVPLPGTDLVPDGWCESHVIPWADEQADRATLLAASARLAGLEAAYKVMDADALELTKGRRYIEVRIGELLGPAEVGTNQFSEGSPAGEGSELHRMERRRFRQLAAHKDKVLELIRTSTEPEEVSRSAVMRVVLGTHVGANSGDNEWYTPAEYTKAAAVVMGGIDLDPCSTAEANESVGAVRFLSIEDDGLEHAWAGRVWMNPPYARPLIDRFCAKLCDHVVTGEVEQACVLVNNATETGWFHALAEVGQALCFPRHRVRYWQPGRDSAIGLQGQAVVYLGHQIEGFRAEFTNFGFTALL